MKTEDSKIKRKNTLFVEEKPLNDIEWPKITL